MKNVFISHSSKDITTANLVVDCLERDGVSVWIAPRDIPAGSNYGASITKGIRECAVLVLIFSKESNDSHAVFREVQMAFDERKVIIPLRIEDVPVSDDLGFYLSGLHWLDAIQNESKFGELVRDVRQVLQSAGRVSIETSPPPHENVPIMPASIPIEAKTTMTQFKTVSNVYAIVKKAALVTLCLLGVLFIVIVVSVLLNPAVTTEPVDELAITQTPTHMPSPEPEPSPTPETTPEPEPEHILWQSLLETAISQSAAFRENITELWVSHYEVYELHWIENGVPVFENVWMVEFQESTPFGMLTRFFLLVADTGEIVYSEDSLNTWWVRPPPSDGQILWEQALEIALAKTDTERKEITGFGIGVFGYSEEIEHPEWDSWGVYIEGIFFGQNVAQDFAINAATGELFEPEW